MYTQRLLIKLLIERVLRWGGDVVDERTHRRFEGILEDEKSRASYVVFSRGIERALRNTMAPYSKIDPTWSQIAKVEKSRPAHDQIADKMISYATFQRDGKSTEAVELVLDLLRMFVIHLDGVGVEVTAEEAAIIEALFTDAATFNALRRPWSMGVTKPSLPQA